MLFQVHSRLHYLGITCELFRYVIKIQTSIELVYFKLIASHKISIYQECREACGGQGVKTENRVGHMKSEYDVQLTFEGDNNVLMQQVDRFFFLNCIYLFTYHIYICNLLNMIP